MTPALALLASLPFAQTSEPPAARPHLSIVIARMVTKKWTGEDTCPPDFICMRYPNRATFDRGKTISGPSVPAKFVGRIWVHAVQPKTRLGMLVERVGDRYEIRAWVYPSKDHKFCFQQTVLAEFSVDLTGADRDGEDACIAE